MVLDFQETGILRRRLVDAKRSHDTHCRRAFQRTDKARIAVQEVWLFRPLFDLSRIQKIATGMGVERSLKGDLPVHHDAGHTMPDAHILKFRRCALCQISIDISLMNDLVTSHFKAVRLQQVGVSQMPGEPLQLGEKPGIVQNQVVFEKAVKVEIAQALAEHGLAFKTQQERLRFGWMVIEVLGGKRQLIQEMSILCGADDNFDADLGILLPVCRPSPAVNGVNDALRPAKKLMHGGNTRRQRRDPGTRAFAERRMASAIAGSSAAWMKVVWNGEKESHDFPRRSGAVCWPEDNDPVASSLNVGVDPLDFVQQ